MKKELKTIILLLLLGVFLIPAYTNNQKTMDDTKRQINLEQRHKGTRSGGGTEVVAYIDGDMITMETNNPAFSPILVEIFDDYGILQAFAEFECDSYAIMDISLLPPGQYEIAVTLDYIYTGSFEK